MRLFSLASIFSVLALAALASAQPQTPGVAAGHIGDAPRVNFADLGNPEKCPARLGQRCAVLDSDSCTSDTAGTNALCTYDGTAWTEGTMGSPFTPDADPSADHSGFDAAVAGAHAGTATDLDDDGSGPEGAYVSNVAGISVLIDPGADGVNFAVGETGTDHNAGGQKIANLGDGTDPGHSINKGQLDTHEADVDAHHPPLWGENVVTDHGADGTAANDKTAFEAAIQAADTAGARVYVPSGTYDLSTYTPQVTTTNFHLVCEDRKSTILDLGGGAQFLLNGDVGGVVRLVNCTVRNSTANVIQIDGAPEISLLELRSNDFTDLGRWVRNLGTRTGRVRRIVVEDNVGLRTHEVLEFGEVPWESGDIHRNRHLDGQRRFLKMGLGSVRGQRNVDITHNVVERLDNTGVANGSAAIEVLGGNGTISHNRFLGCFNTDGAEDVEGAIHAQGVETSGNLTISHNAITDCASASGQGAIFTKGEGEVTVIGNLIRSSQRAGLDSTTSVNADPINSLIVPDHAYATAMGPARLKIESGALPGGLSEGTDYWIIRDDDDTLGLATSEANAVGGTRVTGISTATGTFTLDFGDMGLGIHVFARNSIVLGNRVNGLSGCIRVNAQDPDGLPQNTVVYNNICDDIRDRASSLNANEAIDIIAGNGPVHVSGNILSRIHHEDAVMVGISAVCLPVSGTCEQLAVVDNSILGVSDDVGASANATCIYFAASATASFEDVQVRGNNCRDADDGIRASGTALVDRLAISDNFFSNLADNVLENLSGVVTNVVAHLRDESAAGRIFRDTDLDGVRDADEFYLDGPYPEMLVWQVAFDYGSSITDAQEWVYRSYGFPATLTRCECEAYTGTQFNVQLCQDEDLGDDTCAVAIGSAMGCSTTGATQALSHALTAKQKVTAVVPTGTVSGSVTKGEITCYGVPD